jgi:protein-disulfide isomerase-like protein with CxxC motif
MSCDFIHPVQRTHYEEGKDGQGKKKERIERKEQKPATVQ